MEYRGVQDVARESSRQRLSQRVFRMGMAVILAFALSGFTPNTLAIADDPQADAAVVAQPVEPAEGVAAEADGAAADEAAAGEAAPAADEAAHAADAVAGVEPEALRDAAPAAAAAPAAGEDRDAPLSIAALWVDGTNGSDAADGATEGTALKTIAKALEIRAAHPSISSIYIKGDFSALPATTIPSGVELVIAADAKMTGAGASGITLASGSKMRGVSGATLTMTGFGTALTIASGATLTDGNYSFSENTKGIQVNGAITGSSDRSDVNVVTVDADSTNFYGGSATFTNCTVNVSSQKTTNINFWGTIWGAWIDTKTLSLQNADMTISGIGGGFYVKPEIVHSDLTINKGPKSMGTGMTIQGAGRIIDSTIHVNAGSTAGISVGVTGGVIDVTNSTLDFKNGGVGGLNVNTGTVVLSNSTIKGDGKNSGALFGSQINGIIEFDEECLVETPAAKEADNGAAQKTDGFVVLGGSYLVKYAPDYNASAGSTIPTNGAANGSQKLSLFTLADPALATLNPLNKNGQPYVYSVAHPSSDGEKHVWVPASKVTFMLNADDAAPKVEAAFADGSASDKTALAISGYTLAAAKSVAGGSVEVPANPTAAGYKFLGWFQKDVAGTETAFDPAAAKIERDTDVYAKWEGDASSYAVKYHNGAAADETHFTTLSDPARKATVLTGDEVMNANPNFAIKGKIFKGWTTEPNGQGDAVAPGSTITVPADKNVVDLYADWEDKLLTVKFSANGGVFADDSVFKQNPDVFEIVTDDKGGEVAVVKKHPKASDAVTLDSLLKTEGGAFLINSSTGLACSSWGGANATAMKKMATKKYHVVKGESSFFSDNYYWYIDPAAGKDAHAIIETTTKVTEDITYYLGWKEQTGVEQVQAATAIPSDMWSGTQADTTSIKEVSVGESFSLTGAVDASAVVGQMDALEASIAGGLDDLTKITLADTESSFSATITLPDGVVIPDNPEVTASGLGDCFVLDGATVNGQKVTVTFGLKGNYENYKQLKDAVLSTGKGDVQSITGKRQKRDVSALQKPITVTVNGLTLDADAVANGDELAATGVVSGTFKSYAENTVTGKVKKFTFMWNGEQIADNQDPRGADVRQTLLVVKPYDTKLPADILVGADTEHDSVYEVLPGQKLDFTGSIDAATVKAQMRAIEGQFPGTTDYTQVKLEDMSSSFQASFTVPEKMSLPEGLTKDQVKLEGFADTFAVTDVTVVGKTATVTMDLKGGIANYKDLQDAVNAVGDTMKVTIPGVMVSKELAPGERATVSGEVSGSFKARAIKEATGTKKVFSFKWTGEQSPEGMDATADSIDDGILFTVVAATPLETKLPADMLVGANTEHDAVIKYAQGTSFDLTGAVDAASIQAQMDKIERSYPGANHDTIAIDVVDFGFAASFTVPEGMTLPSDLDATKVKATDFGDGFKVDKVTTSGKTVTVTFVLSDPAAIKTYSDLEKVVDAAGTTDGWMKLEVPGIMVDEDAAVGENLTIVGTVEGSFKASATSAGGTHRAFSFVWTGTQWADGKDAVATDDETIQLTVQATKAKEPNVPGKPENPNPQANPNQPGDNGKPGMTGKTNKVDGKKAASQGKVIPATGEANYALGAGIVAVIAAAVLVFAVRRRMKKH